MTQRQSGDCSFCGETVTGRHAIIHYETAGGDPCVWVNGGAVARSLTPPMLSKQFIQQIVRLDSSSTAHHECRHCGYSVEKDVAECPQCGSHEIAAYDLE